MPPGTTARAPWALLAALGACLFYASAAEGTTALVPRGWLQLALAVVALGAAAGWLYGRGLSVTASRSGWIGLGLLTGFAVWAAASIAWSVAPDRSWAEANTVLAYALATFGGIVLGSSLDRAPERAGLMIAGAMVPIALYALAGKVLPAVDIAGLSFNHTADFARLRAPLGYWNALALACVAGLLPLLRCAADPWRRPRVRLPALVGVFLFALVLGMTYSRGGLLALMVGVVVLLALSTERVRTLVLALSAAIATVPPLAIALGRSDLTGDGVPLGARVDDGLVLLVVTVVTAALLAVWGRAVIALEHSATFTPARGRAVGRPIVLGAAGIVALAAGLFAVTGGAARAFDDFTDVREAASITDPNRLLSRNSGNRWVWWREAAGAFSDRPVAGWGAGSFPVTHRLYRKRALDVQQPHSVALQWLAEDGLVGFVLAAGALGALLAAGLARVRAQPWALAGAPGERGAAAALLAVATAWIAQSFLEWSWDIPGVTVPMFVALGVLAARPRTGAARPVATRGPALTAAAAAAVLFALSVALPALSARATNAALADTAALEVSPEELADAAARAEFAARLNPLAAEPLLDAATIAARRGRDDEARAYLLDAVRRQPFNARAWSRLGTVEFERRDSDGVRRALAKTLELDPASRQAVAFAAQAALGAAPPGESASATGAPLPTEIVVAP
ncbi:MAG: O-antigen ligase family protein [Solirubrobacteraceae bacterium]